MSATSSGRFSIFPARALDDRRLGNAAISVLALLGTYADRDGWCWPSVSTMAKRLGSTRQAVSKQLRVLESSGYLNIEPRTDKRGGMVSNGYRLLFDTDLAGEFDRLHGVTEGDEPPQPVVAPLQPDVAPPATWGCTHYKEERTHKNVTDTERQFSEFRAAYPSRASVDLSDPLKPAREKFLALVRKGVSPDDLIRGAKNYAVAVGTHRTEPRYVPQMVKWLHNEMWTQYRNRPVPKRSAVGMC